VLGLFHADAKIWIGRLQFLDGLGANIIRLSHYHHLFRVSQIESFRERREADGFPPGGRQDYKLPIPPTDLLDSNRINGFALVSAEVHFARPYVCIQSENNSKWMTVVWIAYFFVVVSRCVETPTGK
jgi:hypothetical protein